MDLSDIMASSIHDLKNSLSIIVSNLDDLIASPHNHLANPRQANVLKHEVRRVNRNLVQLLTLYKLGNEQLAVQIAEHNLDEFLEEMVADNSAICTALGLELTYHCDPELMGYFDWELVRGTLDSTIGNATRYARHRILLSAAKENDELVIRVEDDGEGFAQTIIQSCLDAQTHAQNPVMSGRTRLGLYFAACIARLHRNGDQRGRIQLRNNHHLSGACFQLHLP